MYSVSKENKNKLNNNCESLQPGINRVAYHHYQNAQIY